MVLEGNITHIEDFSYCDNPTITEESKYASLDRKSATEMRIQCIENAWIIPWSKEYNDIQGEVLTENGTIISNVCSGNTYENSNDKYSTPTNYLSAEDVIYLGSINKCWGHYITDGICKLWCINCSEVKSLLGRNVPVVFTYEWLIDDTISSSWRHIIDLLGWSTITIIPLTNITKFKHIFIPSNSLQNSIIGRLYTNDFCLIKESLVSAALSHTISLPKHDRIYLSRTRLTSDHAEFGEKSIEKLFKKAGYKILYPEQLSFEEQVFYLYNAAEVAGTMGSISHNFLFCRPQTKVYILRKAWYTNDFQYVINQVSRLNVTYIDVNLSVFLNINSNEGPFFLYVNNNLKKFFLNKYSIKVYENFNRHNFSRYVMSCMKRPRFNERNIAPIYYYEKMTEELNNDIGFLKKIYRRLLLLTGANAKQKIIQNIKHFTR